MFAEGGASYEIKIDTNGNRFVEVDTDVFDNSNEQTIAQVINDIITNRFKNLITAKGQLVRINQKTNLEWRHSKSAETLKRLDPVAYIDKMYSIGNADEILSSAKNWINEKKSHIRKDNIIGFARGNVLYRVDSNGYAADVIVGIKADGSALLYDLVGITKIKIIEAPVSRVSESRPARKVTSIISDSITNYSENSNPSSQNNLNDSDGKFSKDDTIIDPDELDEELLFTSDGDLSFDAYGTNAGKVINVEQLMQEQVAEHG